MAQKRRIPEEGKTLVLKLYILGTIAIPVLIGKMLKDRSIPPIGED